MKQLNVLSFGKNMVTDMEKTVKYIRKLGNENLQVINMEDNPFNYTGQAERDYKQFTICLLSDLRYLDYVFITDDMRRKAEAKLGETLQEIDREAANEQKAGQVEREADPILVKANIDLTEDMMKKIQILSSFP